MLGYFGPKKLLFDSVTLFLRALKLLSFIKFFDHFTNILAALEALKQLLSTLD